MEKETVTESGNQKLYTEISYNLNGFPLRGADNTGRCYSVNTPLKKEDMSKLDSINGAVTKPFIQDMKNLTYFDDPVLTFEDSMLYGCTLELTQAELMQFCRNREWIHLVLFQNLFNLEKFGISGNAAPEFAKDWGTVTTRTSDDPFEMAANESGDTCSFPSTRIVEVYYSKINTNEEPQYTIKQIEHYSVQKK